MDGTRVQRYARKKGEVTGNDASYSKERVREREIISTTREKRDERERGRRKRMQDMPYAREDDAREVEEIQCEE